MSEAPAVNITMPVFNRYEATQKALLALRKSSRQIPFEVTVVDNGSEQALVRRLLEFKEGGLIDHLFLLPRNMGISCAANIGWEMTPAPFYMKLDNDTVMTDPQWLLKLFRLWRHGDPVSTLGGADPETLVKNPGALHTEDGILGICTTNLAGQAILIPRAVSDALGYWSEDYGLYGAEDGDYGLRMNCAGFPQYYYSAQDFFVDLGKNDSNDTYMARNVDKTKEHRRLFKTEGGGTGLFTINDCLYNLCIRSWKPLKRYEVTDIDENCRVSLIEREEYVEFRKYLDLCAQKVNARLQKCKDRKVFTKDFIAELKSLMARSGQDCQGMLQPRAGFMSPATTESGNTSS
ncbi:MAG: glycosyltransferase [Deltaproteobacteria bacterium]|jgi:glycosyltransferase involved in cell wall biosynthesis|nr:glycosyltransferase [Deltaproteobacteria bacterium]